MAMNMTGVAFSGSYGSFTIDRSNIALTIDPKPGTTHVTALTVTGELKVTFAPATFADGEIKEYAIPAWYSFSLSNNNWTFDDDADDEVGAKPIITLEHTEDHEIDWIKQDDGTFTFTLTAEDIAEHLNLTEFDLNSHEKYKAFDAQLKQGNIIFTVTDGNTGGVVTPGN